MGTTQELLWDAFPTERKSLTRVTPTQTEGGPSPSWERAPSAA